MHNSRRTFSLDIDATVQPSCWLTFSRGSRVGALAQNLLPCTTARVQQCINCLLMSRWCLTAAINHWRSIGIVKGSISNLRTIALFLSHFKLNGRQVAVQGHSPQTSGTPLPNFFWENWCLTASTKQLIDTLTWISVSVSGTAAATWGNAKQSSKKTLTSD